MNIRLGSRISVLEGDVTQLAARQMIGVSASAANPIPTAAAGVVMMGLDLAYTPRLSTRAIFIMDGQIGNQANNGDSLARLYYGPGMPPANGVVPPMTSTALGQPVRFVAAAANDYTPFSAAALVTDLVLGQAYWVDVGLQANAGTAFLTDVELTGFGLLDPLTLT